MRLDLVLVERQLARSRSHAHQLIEMGRVHIASIKTLKPSTQVGDDTVIEVREDPYVSRAAHKLIHALDESGIQVGGRALDAGASTGGFTQVLLERGVNLVYAVDVGHGQMAECLCHDPRVVLKEGLNLRDLSLEDVDNEPVDLIVADLSFISLTLIMDRLVSVLRENSCALVLVKPQFEVGRMGLDSHGIVLDDDIRAQAVNSVVECAQGLGWSLIWSAPSVLTGEKGNQEVFCLFKPTVSLESCETQ